MANVILLPYVRIAILVLVFFYGAMSTGWAGDSNSRSSGKVQETTIKMPSGAFTFKLGAFSYDESSLHLRIVARPEDGAHKVKIMDEADALRTFLADASNNGFNIKSLILIVMPATLEEEVQERLAKAAAASETWKRRGKHWRYKDVVELLTASNAFKEIGEVFQEYGLRMTVFGVEKVFAKKQRIEGRPRVSLIVPETATIFIGVKREEER